MTGMALEYMFRRDFDPAALLARHPPALHHPHKQLVFDLACPGNATHRGPITLTRWNAAALPGRVELAATAVEAHPGYYDYAGPDEGVWHVNFADPQLFVAYGSALLAQDELQAAEHPLLGSLREALRAENHPALTDDDVPTPVLVAGVERRCALATAPDLDAGRPYGLYGNRFARASEDVIRGAVRVLSPPTRTNLVAIAAPAGGRGAYSRAQVERILVAAFTGFAAAVEESRRRWPTSPVEIRTGFWGCGAFGGHRHLMTLLQILAARLARVDRIAFYVFDHAGDADFRAGVAALDRVIAAGRPGESLAELLARIVALGYRWGVSDGN